MIGEYAIEEYSQQTTVNIIFTRRVIFAYSWVNLCNVDPVEDDSDDVWEYENDGNLFENYVYNC